MFSDSYYRVLYFQFKLIRIIGGTPLEWDHKKKIFYVTRRSKIRYGIFILNVLPLVVFFIFQTHQAKWFGGSMSDFGFLMACSNCSVLIVILFGMYLPSPENTTGAINAFLEFGNEFNRKLFVQYWVALPW